MYNGEPKKNDSVWILKMFKNYREKYLLTWVITYTSRGYFIKIILIFLASPEEIDIKVMSPSIRSPWHFVHEIMYKSSLFACV